MARIEAPDPDIAAMDPDIAAMDPDIAAMDPDIAAMDPDIAAMDPDIAAMDPDIAAMAAGPRRIRPGRLATCDPENLWFRPRIGEEAFPIPSEKAR